MLGADERSVPLRSITQDNWSYAAARCGEARLSILVETEQRPEGMREDEPVRLVLAGCGAVTKLYYAEALSRLQSRGQIAVAGIFDPDAKQAALLQARLPSAKVAGSFDGLLAMHADIAIIASPTAYHADQSTQALKAGVNVLCEKPLAASSSEADRILAAAAANDLHVATGLVRRQFPATRSIKAMLEGGLIGRLRSVSCFEGGPFQWPVASTTYFSCAESGGGVLQDIGTHCLDLLTWWFGEPDEIHYADDAMGGVEANCLVRLRFGGFEATVRLSRDWARPNLYRLEGERGSISWTVNETEIVNVALNGSRTTGVVSFTNADGPSRDFVDAFCDQISGLVDAVRNGAPLSVPASAGRNVLDLVEGCYARRKLMDMPWLGPEELLNVAARAGTKQ
ncbi:Gfo/Idh/MocA family oxidoreductase [Mesorhizobium sp. M1D.F.Ca.ET.184.01.1.1]|nr:Gfo/Idh/MocA family oxidoreductase [Mesorhizobium sp. M1D.F.Ca.ET.231.01.1.1]TGP33565.1 Gfo/Idh/MocA family oxidoreductase [Mesorhizobium sp. M1D.F.Ca.ET.234.01.1.1]TGS46932.1 Gfo/Idh/MocA family oxidoreductase [Mesorhizobium sp. M1D.F.Ca.ET.184.01.1.1]TGS62191.1 Gfo/Idh/MocA family oxidoreductase [Mesorhizobium sp. M1D.F.Ca.ET.183.01.1.1]